MTKTFSLGCPENLRSVVLRCCLECPWGCHVGSRSRCPRKMLDECAFALKKKSRKWCKSGWELVSPQINVRNEKNVFLLSRDIGQVSRKNLTEILSNCAKEQRPSSFGTLAYLGTKPKSPHPGLSPPICSPVRSERRTGHTTKKTNWKSGTLREALPGPSFFFCGW